MKSATRKLFWEIVNCPWNPLSAQHCSRILAEQDELLNRQVPEPWSGNLETASFLMLGANPALDKVEIFPSRHQKDLWSNRCTKGCLWTDGDVENYFTGRFGKAKCSACGRADAYVQVRGAQIDILKSDTAAGCKYKTAQNSYWAAYLQYAAAVAARDKLSCTVVPSLGDEIVVSDIIHCKGPKQKGVRQALPWCQGYTKRIIELFAGNQSSEHYVFVFGAFKPGQVSLVEKFLRQSFGGLQLICKPAGSYLYRRNGKEYTRDIQEWSLSIKSSEIRIFTNLPAPSGANHAAHDVNFLGETIVWSKKGLEAKAMSLGQQSEEMSYFKGGKLTRGSSYVACNTNPTPRGVDARKIIYRVDQMVDHMRVRLYTCKLWRDVLHALFDEHSEELGADWTWSTGGEPGIEKCVATEKDAVVALNRLYDTFEKKLRRRAANI